MYLNELFRRKISDTVREMPGLYHIMDSEDFESLLALNTRYGIDRVLHEKELSPDRVAEDFRPFLSSLSQRTGIELRNATLQKASDDFFNKITHTLERQLIFRLLLRQK